MKPISLAPKTMVSQNCITVAWCCERVVCVCDIVDILRLPQPTVSRHLAYLRRMGLVEATREWKFAHYRLAEPERAVHQSLLNCARTCFLGIESLNRERIEAEARVKARALEPC
jgi:DNA-binding transcriptional ArsR family regulator